MKVYACHSSLFGRKSLSDKGGNDAGQSISHTACGHARIPRGIHPCPAVRYGNNRRRSFQHKHHMVFLSIPDRFIDPAGFYIFCGKSGKESKFSHVGRQNHISRAVSQIDFLMADSKERVRIHNHGLTAVLQHIRHKGLRSFVPPQTRSQRDNVIHLGLLHCLI